MTPLWAVELWQMGTNGMYDNWRYNWRGKFTTGDDGRVVIHTS